MATGRLNPRRIDPRPGRPCLRPDGAVGRGAARGGWRAGPELPRGGPDPEVGGLARDGPGGAGDGFQGRAVAPGGGRPPAARVDAAVRLDAARCAVTVP